MMMICVSFGVWSRLAVVAHRVVKIAVKRTS